MKTWLKKGTWLKSAALLALPVALLLLIIAGALNVNPASAQDANTGSVAADRAGLVALYHATDGANWRNSTNWLSEKALGEWHGVTVNDDGRVTRLRLDRNNLSGQLAHEIGALSELDQLIISGSKLSGAIPKELGNLSKLIVLNLSEHTLSGTIPPELGKLTKLQQLLIRSSLLLEGRLPQSLTELEELVELRINGTSLCTPQNSEFQAWFEGIRIVTYNSSGRNCPWEDRDSLIELYAATGGENWTNSTNWLSDKPLGEWHGVTVNDDGRVTRLRLDRNNLSGPLPPEIGALSELTRLLIFDSKLSGAIPKELGNLSKLTELSLVDHKLSGTIPPELGKLTKLRLLDVRLSLLLEGRLPQGLTKLEELVQLQIDGTNLCTPQNSEFQAWLQGIRSVVYTLGGDPNCPLEDRDSLIELYAATGGDSWTNSTNWLSEKALGEWHGVTTNDDGRVTGLALSDNNLSGQIPTELDSLGELTTLDISGNSGLCSPLLFGFGEVVSNAIDAANIPDCAPDAASDRRALVALHAATGGANWTNSANWLSEKALGEWHGVTVNDDGRVTGLALPDNSLSGQILTELGSLSELTSLDISDNSLSGQIPVELGSLGELTTLDLSGNSGLCSPLAAGFGEVILNAITTANIPDCATSAASDRRALVALYNATDGENWTNSTNWLSDKPLGEWHGVTANDDGRVTRLDLVNNNLSGPLPPEIGALSELTRLRIFDSKLSGAIPKELGNLSKLTILNLSDHKLSGTIPPELGKLTNLQLLYIRHSPLLAGRLPQSLTELEDLVELLINGTSLCTPQNSEFQAWQQGLTRVVVGSPCALEDRDSLIELYASTDGASWTNSANWLSEKALSEWHGVTVNTEGRVTGLALSDNSLSGQIPVELDSLGELTTLDLSDNSLSGQIPVELGSLGELTTLDISGNSGLCKPLLFGFGEVVSNAIDAANIPDCAPDAASDRRALVALHAATGGENWTNSANWLSDEPMDEWHGVTVNDDGRVTGLALSGNNLSGTIPTELGRLSELTTLDISGNSGLCSPLAAGFGEVILNAITAANIPDCAPDAASDRRALVALYNATGGDSWTNNTNWLSEKPLGEWHGVTTNDDGRVTRLFWVSNNLSGPLPTEIGALSELEYLGIFGSKLNGGIPKELGNLSNLTELALVGHKLSGTIPPELGKLTKLQRLYIQHSLLLEGRLPQSLTNLEELALLQVNGTSLCTPQNSEFQAWQQGINSVVGDNPCAWEDRDSLIELYAATGGDSWTNSTNWLSDKPLGEWHGVTANDQGRVTGLALPDNNLSGQIPVELDELGELTTLDISGNSGLCSPLAAGFGEVILNAITAANIPDCAPDAASDRRVLVALYEATDGENWTNNTNWLSEKPLGEWHGVSTNDQGRVTALDLDSNNLDGQIPTELNELGELTTLDISGNAGLCRPLVVQFGEVVLNAISAANIPDCAPDRRVLVALYEATDGENWTNNTNWLSEKPLGEWHGVSTNDQGRVTALDLDSNNLDGQIPTELNELGELTTLDISGNAGLCRPLVVQFGEVVLNAISAANIPDCAPDAASDGRALVALYNATGGANWKRSNNWNSHREFDQWEGVRTDADGRVTVLTLRDNNLSGTLPVVLGDLTALQSLELGENGLTGSLPAELRNLVNLQRLVLSHNADLSGPLPLELTGLVNLTHFNFYDTGLCAPPDRAFQEWLDSVEYVRGGHCPTPERAELVALYQATGGDDWRHRAKWLTDKRLGEWRGVTVDADGRVIGLSLIDNNLTGAIPTQLPNLERLQTLNLSGNKLSGTLPSWLGDLSSLQTLNLRFNGVHGPVPAEMGRLSNLVELHLGNTRLTGELPQSLTNLTNLKQLTFSVGLCSPNNDQFQEWLAGLESYIGHNCPPPDPDR